MRKITFGILVLFLAGCKNFETQKVSTEEVLRQKLEHFRWDEVDVFPTFENCRHLIEKTEIKRCFEETLTRSIFNKLSQQPVTISDSLQGTVVLHFSISAKGLPRIDSMKIPPQLIKKIPDLKNRLQSSMDSLPKINPATKRGIPVTMSFQLPIQVVSE